MREIFLGMLGLCMGTTIASGVVAFIISLGIVPRFAGITGSAAQVRLYEECSMLGAVLGNVVFLYQRALPLGNPGLAVYGSFSGIFLGSWVPIHSHVCCALDDFIGHEKNNPPNKG